MDKRLVYRVEAIHERYRGVTTSWANVLALVERTGKAYRVNGVYMQYNKKDGSYNGQRVL